MSVPDRYTDLGLAELAPEDRPYTVLNFATTLDGRATIGGRSGPIGSDTDTEVLQTLRTQAEAVMIGAGTMRAERYGAFPGGQLAVIVSGRLALPWDAPLFTEGEGKVLVFTNSDEEPPETATPVDVERQEGEGVNVIDALRFLRQERGIRALLCEGGPRLHAQLWAAGVADELFLTIAPKLAGGDEPRILNGTLPAVQQLELVWAIEEEGELFTRYRRGR